MTPEELFNKRVNELIQSGCSMDEALQTASEEIIDKANQADQSTSNKLQTEWNIEFGQGE